MKILKSIIIGLAVILGVSSVATAAPLYQTSTIYYVKSTPTGSADCSSWVNACGLQDALDKANPGDEIWVAAGTYLPIKPISSIYPKNSPTFNLETGVAIYGGYPSEGGEWGDRDPAAHLTVLSGELGLPDDDSDNSFHVVTARGVDQTAILDGFTISGGLAIGSVGGGGMYNDRGSPTLNNLIFTGNEGRFGAGMYNSGGSPKLTNVTFINNFGYYGGGMHNAGSSPILENVSFINNEAGMYGGGMFNNGNSSPILFNVTFSSNHADQGGGMGILNNSKPLLTNVTFTGNTNLESDFGAAIFTDNSTVNLANTIVWGNTPSANQIFDNDATAFTIASYSIIEGGYEGEANSDADPLLSSLADNGGFTQTHALEPGSPAIDAANPEACPAADQRGHLRFVDTDGDLSEFCDIGAYEFGYTLTMVMLGKGTVNVVPDKLDYYSGEKVTLTANPTTDWSFSTWSGDTTGTENPLVVTFDGNKTINAGFKQMLFRYILVPIFK